MFSSNAKKVAFGGLVGSMTNVNAGTRISGNVDHVNLTVGSSVSAENKGKVRLGFVTGGDYNKENFVAASATPGEITVTACTKVAGTKAVDTPSVLIDGPHEHSYTVSWNDWGQHGNEWVNPVATFTCSCGDTVESHATLTKSSPEAGKLVYTATAANPSGGVVTQDSVPYTQYYHVHSEGSSREYTYGQVADFHSDVAVDWMINNQTRAKNCKDFYFAVTEDAFVSTADASTSELVVVNVKKAVGGTNNMTYQVQWSLPADAQNVHAVIHRTRNDAKDITPEQILVKEGHKVWDTKLNVRNGDYTYNVLNLSSNSVQAVILKITYTYNGNEQTYVSPVKFVNIY